MLYLVIVKMQIWDRVEGKIEAKKWFKNHQKSFKNLQITFKWPSNGFKMATPGEGEGGRGRGVLLTSTAIGFAIYHITRFNFFWGIVSKVYHFIARDPRKRPHFATNQRVRQVPNLELCTTTPYPSNGFQIWRSNCEILNPPSPLRTLQMASKFNRPNARKVATFEFGITTPCLANGLQI